MSEEININVGDIVYWRNSRNNKSGPAEILEVNGDILRVAVAMEPNLGRNGQTKRFNINRGKVINVIPKTP